MTSEDTRDAKAAEQPGQQAPEASEKPAKEPRSKAGWLAFLFVLGLVAWMSSGMLAEKPPEAPKQTAAEKAREPFTVEAFESVAQPVTQFVAAEGQALPDRQTPIRAKVGGTVESVEVRKGDFLQEGDLVAKIALDDRAAQIAQAEAELARRQGDFDRVKGLADRGYATRAELDSARAELAVAESALATVRQASGDTEIRAPISGVLEDFDLDIGEFVTAGAEVGTQIDNDPLTVDIQIAQQNVGRVERGQKASVTFITGVTREGEVTYVASNASAATRTFPVEVTIPNPDRDVPAGISAQVRIPVGETPSHFLSAAILALGPDGELGVKAVEQDNRVGFYPATLVRAETNGIWVTGLPERLRIISVGQGFVSDGETVRPIAPKSGDGVSPASPGAVNSETAMPGAVSSNDQGATQPSGLMNPAGAAPNDQNGSSQAASGDERPQSSLSAVNPAEVLETAALMGGLDENGAPNSQIVRLAQEALSRLGYETGPADGVMGSATRSAIGAFQSDNGLEATGTMTEAFARALASALGAIGSEGN
ncbi:MAG: efflux RND transporter periplasmic adaptor subunit [Fulvimarina manganoxydans]|uniref:efflux RND transporter periplasmic adaptor subunit n=1 Tax=Fulvimarina manganoxydans TaxID=937218 RepID=UPI002355B61E|nr:efflux RND transporter periplasmic adaptor subunit [Fulvimarina manganoxydans]MCK5933262.1 efflux RND transporter periplasmic adaptor subunit [Fulvimarina manganoxydans]